MFGDDRKVVGNDFNGSGGDKKGFRDNGRGAMKMLPRIPKK